MSDFRLEHINIPSKNPMDLAKWYSSTFGLLADNHIARGEGILMVFQEGTPIQSPDTFHRVFLLPTSRSRGELYRDLR